jgi:Xaa-Pro aminopeptidase
MSGAPLFHPERVRTELEQAGADALLAATPANVLYLTRYRKGGRAMALVRRAAPDRPLLAVPAADLDFVLEDLVDGAELRAFGVFHRFRAEDGDLAGRDALIDRVARAAQPDADAADLIAAVLREHDIAGKVIVDLPPASLGRLAADATLEHRPGVLRRLRMVKTSEEIRRLAAAAEITEEAILRTNAQVEPGVRQRELACAFAVAVAEAASQVRLANVSLGSGTALGNVNQPDDVVEPGALVRYDVGVVHQGYVSDVSRCFSVGPPSQKAARYHRALVDGQAAALGMLRPGVRARELFTTAVTTVRRAGIAHYDRVNVGHGIGVAGDGYDAPLLGPGDDTVIEAGTVLCVETPYYELGFGGLQVEDMVVVTHDGFDSLTRLPRELGVLA